MINIFENYTLPNSLQKALQNIQKEFCFEKLTDVQSKIIPPALEGKDIIVSAPTGTGKTLAFGIPIVAQLINNPESKAIIITPTRELAIQVVEVFQSLLKFNKDIKSVLLIGGLDINKQLAKLKFNPQIIVGTPGRINDHLKRKTLHLESTNFIVLDEIDRMLDMGFTVQVDHIFKFLPKQKQIFMLSATIPDSIIKMSGKYLHHPVKVSINPEEIINLNIKQEFIHTSKDDKYQKLLEVLSLTDTEDMVIIFVKTKRGSDILSKKLRKASYKALSLHGDLRQRQREKVLKLFKEQTCRIIVATNVAARGIDIPNVKYVINYQLPTDLEDYVHRVGRTGRAGQKGHAYCFISPDEKKLWQSLERFLNPEKFLNKKVTTSSSNKRNKKYPRKKNFIRKKRTKARG